MRFLSAEGGLRDPPLRDEYHEKAPMQPDEKSERFPRKFTKRPSCGLTTQWEKQENGKTITRYVGSDGVLYESIRGDG